MPPLESCFCFCFCFSSSACPPLCLLLHTGKAPRGGPRPGDLHFLFLFLVWVARRLGRWALEAINIQALELLLNENVELGFGFYWALLGAGCVCLFSFFLIPTRGRARATRHALRAWARGLRVRTEPVFGWFGLVWVGLGWVRWDCARGISPPRNTSPDPLNSRAERAEFGLPTEPRIY